MHIEPRDSAARARRTARAAILSVAAFLLHAGIPAHARADSVALVWTAPGDDGNTGRASTYEMRYSENPVSADTTSWWAAAISVGALPPPLAAGSRESYIVTGLAPGKTFYFAIRASDEVPNVSGFSNIATKQTTSGPVTLATPANFHAAFDASTVVLTWSPIPTGGAELGYRLYRGGDQAPPSLLATLPLSATWYRDSTTVSGSAYNYSLVTYDDNAESAPAVLRAVVPQPGGVTADANVHGYPNPARDQVTFRLNVTSTSDAPTRITVFDLTGHKICLLADQVMPPGEHAITWPCMSDAGYHVAPGIYNVIVDGPSGRAVTRVAIVP